MESKQILIIFILLVLVLCIAPMLFKVDPKKKYKLSEGETPLF